MLKGILESEEVYLRELDTLLMVRSTHTDTSANLHFSVLIFSSLFLLFIDRLSSLVRWTEYYFTAIKTIRLLVFHFCFVVQLLPHLL